MNILFIYSSTGKWELASQILVPADAYLPPLGLLYLGRVLEDAGHHVEIIDCNIEGFDTDRLQQKIRQADMIGMTVYTEPREQRNTILIAHAIKHIAPDVPLVIGGPHCTLFPKESLQTHNADISVPGEGVFCITKLIDALGGKRPLSSVPGIYIKRKNGMILKTKPDQQQRTLDDIPFPARHLVEKYEYGYMMGVKVMNGKVTTIITSRGCPNHCRFCQIHAIVPKYQTRSVENITAEIAEVLQQGYTTLVFVDDNFLAQKKKAEQVMDFIIAQHVDIDIHIINARVDSADRALYEKLRQAGVVSINFGIESGDQGVLDFYQKQITLQQIRTAVKLAREMGFFTCGNFIFGAPIETKTHIEKTIAFAKSLALDSAHFFNLGFIYGSQLWKEEVAKGTIQPHEQWVLAESQRGLGCFTNRQLDQFNTKAYQSFYFRPVHILREVYKAVKNQDFRYLLVGVKMALLQ